MAPSRKNARKPRRTMNNNKKKQLQETNSMKPCSSDDLGVVLYPIGCTTPKAKKHQIPEVVKCPPAPKKRRLVSSCTLRRTPISFFDPPDIELFFASHLASIYKHVHTHVR